MSRPREYDDRTVLLCVSPELLSIPGARLAFVRPVTEPGA